MASLKYILFILSLFIGEISDSAADRPTADTLYYIDSSTWQIRSLADHSTEKIVLLTIDDGPKAYTTPGFLDLLDQYDAKALFFINGYLAEHIPWVVRQILDHGHMVGNHSWSHKRLTEISKDQTKEEIMKLNKWLESEIGYKPLFFRAPYGMMTPEATEILKENEMAGMGWSVNSYDWRYPDNEDTMDSNAAEIAERTLLSMDGGNIILMHDRAVSLAALEIILEELTDRGYRFVLPSYSY